MQPPDDHATRLLRDLCDGDPDAREELFRLVYDQLVVLARAHMAREGASHTLQPTALVHEAYLRMIQQQDAHYPSRGHFYALASKVMRSLLVDHARRKSARKRGGDRAREPLDDGLPQALVGPEGLDVLEVHDALEELARIDPERARLVELRWFGGLSMEEAAEAVDLPMRTAERRWRTASAWLRDRLA